MSLVTFGLLFFISGCCSLIYETLWIRALSLGVGSTSAAMSLVLAIFFTGLSLGSWFAGKLTRNPARGMHWYALLEASIGIYGLVVIYPLVHFHSLLALLPFTGPWSWMGHLFKFILCALLLLLPTLAMGATLPLLVNYFQAARGKRQDVISLLYGINTLGAAAGTLFASFWLIPRFGITLSNQVAAIANLAIAGLSLVLARRALPSIPAAETAAPRHSLPFSRLERGLLVVAVACGFSSLASEVVWNKYLGIFLGNNIYGLGLVLSLYLLGIALGAFLLHRFLHRLPRREVALCVGLVAAAIFTTATAYFFNLAPVGALFLAYATGSGGSLLVFKCVIVALMLFPVTIIFGGLFPLVVHLLAGEKRENGRAVSWVYSINTLGAIVGSYLAGIWLIPHLGSTWTIRIAALALVAATGYLVTLIFPQRRWAPAAVGALAVLVVVSPGVNFTNILKSAYIQKLDPNSFSQTVKYFEKDYEEYVWLGEGETSIISLSHDPKDGESYKNYLRLKTNGLNESVYNQTNLIQLPRYEALLGLIPFLFSEKPETAFVVGYGGGFTVDWMTSLPFAKVHVVELEKAILDAAQVVHKGKNPLLRRKNLDLSVEDARFVLATKMHAPLDIIVSQPSHSWLTGAANLFTRDFFEIVAANLAPKGVFAQWLNLYNMDVTTLKSILGTFFSVFPDGAVFSGENDQEMILIGSKEKLKFNYARAKWLESQPGLLRKLTDVPFRSAPDLFAHFALSRKQVLELTAASPVNSDDNAYAETRQSRLFYNGVPAAELPQAFLTDNYAADYESLLPEGTHWEYPILASQQKNNQHQKFFRLLSRYEAAEQNNQESWSRLGYLCLKAQRYESGLLYLRKAFALKKETNTFNLLLSALTETGRNQEAGRLANQYRGLSDKITECYSLNAEVALGNLAAADRLGNKLISDIPGYTAACGDFFNRLIGDYYFAKKKFGIALPFYEAYYRAYSQDVVVLKKMAAAYIAQNDWSNAKSFSSYLPSVAAGEKRQLESLVKFYEKQKLFADAKVLQAKVHLMDESEGESASD